VIILISASQFLCSFFFFIVVLWCEIRTSHLPGRCSITWATPPSSIFVFLMVFLNWKTCILLKSNDFCGPWFCVVCKKSLLNSTSQLFSLKLFIVLPLTLSLYLFELMLVQVRV
jgi:hypothetical protein